MSEEVLEMNISEMSEVQINRMLILLEEELNNRKFKKNEIINKKN
jgi:hypothetical protein